MDDGNPELRKKSAIERAERLAAHAKDRGEEGLEDLARRLFPEWSAFRSVAGKVRDVSVGLPTQAPEKYQGLVGPETPPEFVQRVYGRWLGQGLTRAHIRKLDWTLYNAIHNWLKRPGNTWPADVDLPTKAEQNSRDLEVLRTKAPDGRIGLLLGDVNALEAARIRGAMHRRKK